ncbi:hypothetical protein [Solidesulfovibrio sp.]
MSAASRARTAWDGMAPEWVMALAEACDLASGRAVAARLDVSTAAVSRVLGNTYGDTAAMERRVREVLMTNRVACPVVGEISVADCRANQARPFTAVNPIFVQLARACRACPHREAKGA